MAVLRGVFEKMDLQQQQKQKQQAQKSAWGTAVQSVSTAEVRHSLATDFADDKEKRCQLQQMNDAEEVLFLVLERYGIFN